MQNWYLYKNGALLAGPTHFMSAVAAMNRLSVIGYPGNNIFQKKRVYAVGSDIYTLSTDAPNKTDTTANTGVAQNITQLSKSMHQTVVKAVGVKFLDDLTLHRVTHKVYHYLTDLNFKPGDKCVILTPENSLKVATIEYVSDDQKLISTHSKWVVDRIDMDAHNNRENTAKQKEQREARAAEIRKALDEKLAAVTEMQKYTVLGDAQSAQLLEELRNISV